MDLFNLSARLSLDSSGYNRELVETERETKSFAERLSASTVAIGQMIGNFASKAISSVASQTKTLIQSAVKSYGRYEQLVGGVETLFGAGGKSLEEYIKETGDSSEKNIQKFNRLMQGQQTVMDNAKKAYKTAGMSANDYMDTVTSFAASLVSSLRGDTVNAAIYADMAIQDMADNANKMGTDISSIQSAYQGFAKQNYSMLDNLKLGYGGTKSEMERLLKDAMKISGRKFNLNNLADIYEAIHIIQTELGITGTTAKEAEGTIEGSINMMKASWENLLTAFGDPDADLNEKIDEFTYSVKTVVKNLFPVFRRVMSNVWSSLKDAAAKLPGLIFGENEKGEVNWPTWEDVKAAGLAAWEWIKQKAANLAGLVFGENEDGTVKWPTWQDVSDAATKAWNKIKEKAKALAGLVFGTKEDGSVDWPTWEDVKKKAGEIWGDIQEGAKSIAATFGELVFGKAEDGTVAWPDITKLSTDVKTWWDETATPAILNATQWTLQLFGVPDETAEKITAVVGGWFDQVENIVQAACGWILPLFSASEEDEGLSAADVGKKVADWWKGVVGAAVDALKWALGIPDMMSDDESAKLTNNIQSWWDTTIKPGLHLVLDFTAGFLGFDSIEDMASKMYDYMWDNFGWLFDFLGIKRNPDAFDLSSVKNLQANRAGYNFAMQNNNGQISRYEGINSIISDIDDMFESGTQEDFEKFAQNMIDLAKTDAGKGLFSQEVIEALETMEEVGEFTPNEIKALAEAIQSELMKSMVGVANNEQDAINKANELSNAIVALSKQKIDIKVNFIPGTRITGYSGMFDPTGQFKFPGISNAKGLDYVPYDEYPALLHRGEQVLTASQARRYQNGGMSTSDMNTLVENLTSAIRNSMENVTVRSYLGSQDVTDDVNRNTVRQLKARRFAT